MRGIHYLRRGGKQTLLLMAMVLPCSIPTLRGEEKGDAPVTPSTQEPQLPVEQNDPLKTVFEYVDQSNRNLPRLGSPASTALTASATVFPENEPPAPSVFDLFDHADGISLKSLFDSVHQPSESGKKWYDKLSLRGYSQFRFGRMLTNEGGKPSLLGDRSLREDKGTFSIRRARLILEGDVSEHLFLYFQTDFANNPADGPDTFFAQIRDLYGDIYIDTDKVHRFRVGESKLPWGFEEMQSSSQRIPLDRSDAIDSGNTPNQRDLGVFYYWTPVEKQKLLDDLVKGGLRGSGNYGILGVGIYNGQGGGTTDLNRSLHTVVRGTWPFQLASGQVVEVSLQGYAGRQVIAGDEIRPLGQGEVITPARTGYPGIREQRLAASFVWYPQPFGFQTEWNVGEGPGLSDDQTKIQVRALSGGYVMGMYKIDTANYGVITPYSRYQHYRGGYRSQANAPYGNHDEYDIGVEWQIRKELEFTVEYGFVDGIGLQGSDDLGVMPYAPFRGQMLRCQMQINY
jgi:hypothetical protein